MKAVAMHRIALQFALSSLVFASCLRVPDAHTDGGGRAPDARSAGPPRVLYTIVTDRLDRPWDKTAIPRSPRVRIALSEPPIEGDLPMWIFSGAPDDELLRDLADDPLRIDTRARALASDLERS